MVADVGSGFGFITFWLILSGAKKVYTIGDPSRIGFIKKLYEKAVSRQIIDNGKISFKAEFIKVGNISLADNIKNDTLSLVLLNDTLEHITPRIFPWLVKAVYNNLKPGGYFISRQQNTDSPSVLKRLQPFWKESERNIFFNQRLELINKRIKDINENDAQKLAKHTRGLDSIDFSDALNKYKSKKVLPNHDLNIPPIDIEIDVVQEGNTSIKIITSEFRKNNFKVIHVYPDMLNSRRSKYLQPLAKILPKIFLKWHIFDGSTVFWIRK